MLKKLFWTNKKHKPKIIKLKKNPQYVSYLMNAPIMCGILYLSFNVQGRSCHEETKACAFTKHIRKTNYRNKKCKTDEENNGLNILFASDTCILVDHCFAIRVL